MYKMVVFHLFVSDKDSQEMCFEESFSFANIKPDMVLGILFLTINNTNIESQAWDLDWKSNITKDIFPITKKVKLKKKKLVVSALDLEYKAFIV